MFNNEWYAKYVYTGSSLWAAVTAVFIALLTNSSVPNSFDLISVVLVKKCVVPVMRCMINRLVKIIKKWP